jgi:hypothetical protein
MDKRTPGAALARVTASFRVHSVAHLLRVSGFDFTKVARLVSMFRSRCCLAAGSRQV